MATHPTAVVDDGAILGANVKIWHFCHVSAGAQIGDDTSLGQNVYVAPTAVIGKRVRVQNNVSIYDGVTIDDDAFIGPSAVFTNVRLGRYAFVGAGAVVTTDVKPFALVLGVPARQHGWMCRCGERLPADLHCTCGRSYQLTGDELE